MPVLPDDTVETLHERIKAVERRLYPEVLRRDRRRDASERPDAHDPRALLSVYDKTGIVELARALQRARLELVSSGGTATALADGRHRRSPTVDDITGVAARSSATGS